MARPRKLSSRDRAWLLDELERHVAIVEQLHPDHWPRWVTVIAECIQAGTCEYITEDGCIRPTKMSNTWTRACVPDQYTDKLMARVGEPLRAAIIEALEQAKGVEPCE